MLCCAVMCRYIFLPRSFSGWIASIKAFMLPEYGSSDLSVADLAAACDVLQSDCAGFQNQGFLFMDNIQLEQYVSHGHKHLPTVKPV